MNAGIDPGRWKIGAAFAEDGRLLFSAIVPVEKREILFEAFRSGRWGTLSEFVREGSAEAAAGRTLSEIYIGNGTSSDEFRAAFPLPLRSKAGSRFPATRASRTDR